MTTTEITPADSIAPTTAAPTGEAPAQEVPERAETEGVTARKPPHPLAELFVKTFRDSSRWWIEKYHRHQVIIEGLEPEGPAMLACNHGYGGLLDLNIWAVFGAAHYAGWEREIVPLVHGAMWDIGLGPIIEAQKAVPASNAGAKQAFAEGHHVMVFPGGDLDMAKPYKHRRNVDFRQRTGYARLAMEAGVPLVPIVTAGSGEALYIITDGQKLARLLRLDKRFRLKVMPTGFAFPFGLQTNILGFPWPPYLAMPTKLQTVIMSPMWANEGETAEEFAHRVVDAMQKRMDQLHRGRIPILG